ASIGETSSSPLDGSGGPNAERDSEANRSLLQNLPSYSAEEVCQALAPHGFACEELKPSAVEGKEAWRDEELQLRLVAEAFDGAAGVLIIASGEAAATPYLACVRDAAGCLTRRDVVAGRQAQALSVEDFVALRLGAAARCFRVLRQPPG
ncbi:unnamed protein product, partial [Polarella glacialis]